jgi:hypothetical protein
VGRTARWNWRGSSGDEEACRGKSCSGRRMVGGVVPAVIRGDGGWLCHSGDVSAKGFEESR